MRTCLTIFVIIISVAFANSQTVDPDIKRFGIRAGVNVSHINFSKGEPPSDITTSWDPGFVAGFVLHVPITSKLSIQPEYLFSQMNSSLEEEDVSLKLNYLSLPVFLKFQLTDKIGVIAGPQFDLLISASGDFEGDKDLTHDMEERSIAATFGVEFAFLKAVSISARYMHGLNHIGFNQRSDVQEFKFEMIQLTGCLRF